MAEIRIAQRSYRGGQNDSAATTSQMQPDEVTSLINFRPSELGSAEARGGTRRLSSAAIVSPTFSTQQHIRPFSPTGGGSQLVAFVGSAMYSSGDYGVTWTSRATGLTGGYWSTVELEEGASHVFVAVSSGGDRLVWDGAAATTGAGTGLPAGAKHLAYVNERLWVSTGTNRVQASKIAAYNNFSTSAGALDLPIGDGAPITGLAPFRGALYVFKRRNVSRVIGYGQADLIVAAGGDGVSESVGALSHNSVVAAGDMGLCWLSDRGLELYSGDAVQRIGMGLRAFYQTIDRQACATGKAHSFWYPPKNEVWCFCPTTLFADYQQGFAVSLDTGAAWQFEFGAGPASICLAPISYSGAALQDRPVAVDFNGWPVVMETGFLASVASNGAGGSAISGRVGLTNADFQDPVRRKWLRQVTLLAQSRSGYGIVLSGVGDGSATGSSDEWTPSALTPSTQRFGVSARGVSVGFRVTGGTNGIGGITLVSHEMMGRIWDRR